MKAQANTKNSRRGLLRTLQAFLPKKLKHELIRQTIKIPSVLPESLIIKVAETKSELEQAYRILHDSYVEMGYAKPQECGMRITKYFALPTTTTFVALWDGQVVGTMSLIRQSTMGLPLEKEFDLSQIRQSGAMIAEVSSLAIHRDFRHQRGSIFLPLCKYFHDYARLYMKVDAAVIAVNPSWVDFYEGFLLFEKLQAKTVSNYDFANGAPAVGLVLDFRTFNLRYDEVYGHREDESNLRDFFLLSKFVNLQFPKHLSPKQVMTPVMTPAMLRYFFFETVNVWEQLSNFEKLHLANSYPLEQFVTAFPEYRKFGVRRNLRFHLVGQVFQVEGHDLQQMAKIIDGSATGLRLFGFTGLERNQKLKIAVYLEEENAFEIEVAVMWVNNEDSTCGVRLLQSHPTWTRCQRDLTQGFLPLHRQMNSKVGAQVAGQAVGQVAGMSNATLNASRLTHDPRMKKNQSSKYLA